MKKSLMLIHGAWHGSWVWDEITPLLNISKYEILAPNLPGHEKTLNLSNVTFDNYISYLVEILQASDNKFILVGHSMAGIIISQLAEIIPEKIEKIIYLAAFVPDNNGSLIDEEKKSASPSVSKQVIIDEKQNRIYFKPEADLKELFYNKCDPKKAELAVGKLVDQPLRPFIAKVNLSENFDNVEKIYIECLQDKAISIQDQVRMRSKIECEVISLNSDHSPFFSAVNELAHILNNI